MAETGLTKILEVINSWKKAGYDEERRRTAEYGGLAGGEWRHAVDRQRRTAERTVTGNEGCKEDGGGG